MPVCPRCTCKDCTSIRFQNVPFGDIADGALVAYRGGRIPHAITGLLVWAGVEALNYVRGSWRCSFCGHVF